MKRIIPTLAIALLFLLVGVLGSESLTVKWQEASGRRYVMAAIVEMADAWDHGALDKRAHAVLVEVLKKNNQSTAEYFKVLAKLGKHESSECSLSGMLTVSHPAHYVSAGYQCQVKYANGSAVVSLELRKDKAVEGWKIAKLNVDSPVFSQETDKQEKEGGV